MEDEFVVLELFSDETEATVVKGFLEANGITTYIVDSDPGCIRSLHAGVNVNFAVRLMVSLSDLREAQELLKDN